MKRCIIITAYNPDGFPTCVKPTTDDTIICADSGWLLAKAENIRPDFIIGDFDSDPALSLKRPAKNSAAASERPTAGSCSAAASGPAADAAEIAETDEASERGRLKSAAKPDNRPEADPFASTASIIRVPSEKDDTDTMLCIKKGLELGMDAFVIVGGIGGRLDHTVANIQSLAYICDHGASASLIDPKNRVFLSDPGSITLTRENGFKFSLYAFSDHCEGITLHGAKYPLTDFRMVNSFPLGTSNEFEDETVTVSFTKGRLLVIMSWGG